MKFQTHLNKLQINQFIIWLLPVVVALFLLLFRLSDVAGLHRDEAAFGLFAESIKDGLRPVRGYFNLYTSPVHSYIIAVFFKIFGESVWSLRINGVLLNLLALWAYIDVVRRLFPRQVLWSFWFLITLPAFVVFARIAGENYSLNPLFLFGGIWCFYVLGRNKSYRISRTGYFCTGLIFYLGIWNHIVFLPTVLSVIGVYLIASKIKIKDVIIIFPWFFIGVFIGAIPRLYGILALEYAWIPPIQSKGIPPFSEAFLNMLHTLGGNALYIRVCGEILLSLNWFLPLSLISSIVVMVMAKVPVKQKKMWLCIVLCTILSFVGTWFITPPGLVGSRLWLLPLWFIPVLLAISLSTFKKWISVALGCVIISVNLLNTGINYFYNFLEDGGIPKSSVYVGGRYDNSRDFIDIRPLAEKISHRMEQQIFIQDFTVHRLQFLMPKSHRKKIRLLPDIIKDSQNFPINSLIVVYKTVNQAPSVIGKIGRTTVVLKPDVSTPHFNVYQVVSSTIQNYSSRF